MTSHFAPRFPLRRALRCTPTWLVLCLAACPIVWPATAFGIDGSFPAQPVSDAERAAVDAIVAFLDGGPGAVVPRLSAASPMRAVSTSHALDEIAVRMGSPEGSTWTLQTPGRTFEGRSDLAIFSVEFASGLDDIILMDMAQENGSWLIHRIRCTADPRMPRESAEDEMNQFFEQSKSEAVVPTASGDIGNYDGDRRQFGPAPPGLVLALALASGLILALLLLTNRQLMNRQFPSRRRTALVILITSGALVLGGCGLFSKEDQVEKEPYVELDPLELGPLLPLRQVLTTARSRTSAERQNLQQQVGELVSELVGALDAGNEVAVAARAWQSQLMVLDGNLGAAGKILGAIPLPDSIPLAAIVRGRLAAQQADPAVAERYETARRLGPDHDGLALEAAWAAWAVGNTGEMERHMRSQVYMRSRDATGHYYATKFDSVQGQATAAAKLFLAAWEREPLSRFDLLREPLLTQSARHPAVFEALDLTNVVQPPMGPRATATRPLAVPERATSHVLGESLVVALGDGPKARVLRIPGGGDLVPDGTVVESPNDRANREADEAMARFDEMAADMLEGIPLRRTHRQAVEALSENLLRKEQWRKLIELTDPLAAKPGLVPPSLMQNRALAQIRTGRSQSAAKLLDELAQDGLIRQRRPPTTYYQLGELLVEVGRYETALRATQRAAGLGAHEFTTTRQKQIELMAALHRDTSVFGSRHFRMIYPAPAAETYPRQLSWVMEAEWQRISAWIPVADNTKSEVHVVPHGLYREAYAKAGARAAGLYDGVPRVPFAEFETFQEDFIRTLSHQTSHAMIDQATRGRAPRWFHEGLSRHVEMHQRDANPMPDLLADGRDIAIQLLDPIFEGWVDSQLVETAYAHATWAVRYVESLEGPSGIHRMLSEFRRGNDTSGAIRKALGLSVERFDHDFREWAAGEAPRVWRVEVVSYQDKFSDERRREALDPLQTKEDKARAADTSPVVTARMRREMNEWHAGYAEAARSVKIELAKALPLIQGQKDGDIEAACRDLRGELDRLLGTRTHLGSPDPNVASALRRAYGSFLDMTQKCRSREWKNMREDMERAIQYLGKAQEEMQIYGLKP